ncbi:enoyl-CoA hydratase/isomerase family protein [Streptomyces sp. NPDC055078]
MSDLDRYRDYTALSFVREGGVLVVRLNRPEVFNAIDGHLHGELARVFTDIRDDDLTRAVVLTGEGDAFSAGGDLSQVTSGAGDRLDLTFAEARQIVLGLLEVRQPVIAAVNGSAMGLGATIAMLCDVVYAGESAVLGDPHVRVGIGAGDGSMVVWPWLVGIHRAKEYLMTGDRIAAAEAERIGLVNHVVPDDELLPAALRLAERLAGGSQRAIEGTKAVLNKILLDTAGLVLDSGLAMEKECFARGDHLEPVRIFRERQAASRG